MRTAFIKQLIMLAEQDDRIMLITGDLGFSVLEEFMQRFPKRYINVGVAEQNMMGIASGLALSGKIVFTYSIANFATLRCLEQIRDDVCYHHANVKIVSVGAGFSYGTQGYTHFGLEDIAIMRSLPGMNVFSPSDPVETVLSVKQAVATPGPCYLRLGKANEVMIHANPNALEDLPFPTFINLQHPTSSRISVLVTGSIAATVKDYLAKQQLPFNLFTVPHIKPIDSETLAAIAKHSDVIFTVEEHQLSGGFGSAILEALERLVHTKKLLQFPIVKRIAVSDMIPKSIGSQQYLRECIDLSLLSLENSSYD